MSLRSDDAPSLYLPGVSHSGPSVSCTSTRCCTACFACRIPPAATLPVALCMLEAIRDVYEETGRRVGFKAAGGIRQAKQAVQHLVLVHETLGPEWLTPELYRLGASTLLNDILMQLRKERTGAYQSGDYFTRD